jgi:hypothetical protein
MITVLVIVGSASWRSDIRMVSDRTQRAVNFSTRKDKLTITD